MFALTFPHLCLILATIGVLMVILLPGLVSWTAKAERGRKELTVGFRPYKVTRKGTVKL